MRPPTLRLGSTGEHVVKWQRVIEQLETGTFDESTEDATKAWQRLRGLSPDGIVGGQTWGVAGFASEQLVPVVRTTPTMAEYVRAVMRCWATLFGGVPLEQSIGVLYAQYITETGGKSCFNWNIGNVKHSAGDGFDYHMLNGVWEGYDPAAAAQLVARGEAVRDPSADHAKAVGAGRESIIFVPPHPQTWFRAFKTLDEGMHEHLQLLSRRFKAAWPAVLAGDFVGFAHALKAQRYFTASAGAYAIVMKRPFEALVASSTYEDLVASMHVEPETVGEELEDGIASVHDLHAEFAELVAIAHQGASGLIVEDLVSSFQKRHIE